MNLRRALLSLVAAASIAHPLVAHAQPAGKLSRIGYIGPSAETAPHLLKAFQQGLADFGYVEGRNIAIEYRWTNAGTGMTNESELLANARALIALKVDVLVASIDPAIVAASKATGSVPIAAGTVGNIDGPGERCGRGPRPP